MSTLGAGERSLRAPATPSMTARPWTGSITPGCVTGPATRRGRDHFEPPSSDCDMSSNAWWPVEDTVPTPNTYALPRLSVRMVQPSAGLRWLLFAAAVIWCVRQVSPPSCETPTNSGAGAALPLFSCPRNAAQQAYTVPKNGLDSALSAQICSLSENVVPDCWLMITGCIQAALPEGPPKAAVSGSSVRETAIASKPLNTLSERVAPRFDVRLA